MIDVEMSQTNRPLWIAKEYLMKEGAWHTTNASHGLGPNADREQRAEQTKRKTAGANR
jgi:hypothetical protein